jgi:hypothetical protein
VCRVQLRCGAGEKGGVWERGDLGGSGSGRLGVRGSRGQRSLDRRLEQVGREGEGSRSLARSGSMRIPSALLPLLLHLQHSLDAPSLVERKHNKRAYHRTPVHIPTLHAWSMPAVGTLRPPSCRLARSTQHSALRTQDAVRRRSWGTLTETTGVL